VVTLFGWTTSLARLRELGTRFVEVCPENQLAKPPDPDESDEFVSVVDESGALREWFNQNLSPIIFIRPDRIVAAACQPQSAENTACQVFDAVSLTPLGVGEAKILAV
jgi:3-(3-hydroxy-phenyl)propionate hydroxylase